jgi:recombination protein RecT
MGQMKKLAEVIDQLEPKAEAEVKKPVTFALAMKDQLEGARDQIMRALPNHIDAERFIMVALTAITRNDKLQECGLPSVYLAVMECARLGLFPDNREAAIIPYKGVATLQPMVQGITRLMLRSPGLLKVEARAVFEGDVFHFNYGLHPDLVHVPQGTDTATRKVTHAYAIMWRQGTEPTFEVIDRDVIEQVRLKSKAPDSPAWSNPIYYPEMARKVALKRMGKYADLSPEATRAIALDNLVVGGADWTEAEPEGISPEYRNQIVRAQTQGSIERLKERMSADKQMQQVHPPLEQEVVQAEPAVPETEASAEASTEPAQDETAQPAAKAKPSKKPGSKIAGGDVTGFWKAVNEIGLERVCEDLHINAGDTKENQDHLRKWIESEMRGIWADGTKYLLEAYPDLAGKE